MRASTSNVSHVYHDFFMCVTARYHICIMNFVCVTAMYHICTMIFLCASRRCSDTPYVNVWSPGLGLAPMSDEEVARIQANQAVFRQYVRRLGTPLGAAQSAALCSIDCLEASSVSCTIVTPSFKQTQTAHSLLFSLFFGFM